MKMDIIKTVYCISLTLVLIGVTSGQSFEKKQLDGKRAPCANEGERVPVDDIDKQRCYSCICKNGYVECNNDCPDIDGCHLIVSDSCCKRCKGCTYNGINYRSNTEWTDPGDPCKVLRCEAGVVTISNLHCHTPCRNPLPPEPGKCCPTCPECKINGQIASDDRDVVSDDPCLKCRCSKGRMICSKKACPVLQCSVSRQHHPPGECCPRCKGTRTMLLPMNMCSIQNSFIREGHQFNIDKCSNCTCQDSTSVCWRGACPILDCAPDLQKSTPGSCCKKCVKPATEELITQCHHAGKTYEDGQFWKLDACSSCTCQNGQSSCAKTRCNTTCAPGTRQVRMPGECCSKCVEVEGACMVFGDPHYKTFDGKMYTFKGVGKYQLTADCFNNTFSIKVANIATSKLSTTTKRVAVTFGDIRINLQQRGRVKFNGERIKAPYKKEGKFRIKKISDVIEVTLQNGVKLFWNGKSFLEVVVPATYKKKLCGLCGNFNSNVQDDLTTKSGKVVTDKELLSFGSSWCVGKRKDCAKKIKTSHKQTCNRYRPDKSPCKYLTREHFAACEPKLSYNKYYKACKMDMCHCPDGRCYCDSLMAYARECERLGIRLLNWQKNNYCEANSVRRPHTKQRKLNHSSLEESLLRFQRLSTNFTKSRLKDPIPLE